MIIVAWRDTIIWITQLLSYIYLYAYLIAPAWYKEARIGVKVLVTFFSFQEEDLLVFFRTLANLSDAFG